MKKSLEAFMLSLLFFAFTTHEKNGYKNPKLPVQQRVKDLISKMSIEEKARQLDMYSGSEITSNNKLIIEKIDTVVDDKGIGSIHDLYPVDPQLANDIQKYLVENTRLGIPALMIEEALHGYQGSKGTCFPVPIAMSSMWDKDLMYKIGRVIGTEARSHGIHFVLSPVLGLAQEPRWGRVEETYGEDPYLSAMNGVAIIKGMQGKSIKDQNTVISEPKHFAVHSIPEGGTNTSPVHIGEREARESFLYVFEKAVIGGGALGVMAAYHDWDGVPCVANPFLLKKILREEWGFKGMVLSDLGAIRRLNTDHFTVETPEDAISSVIKSGLDMQFYDYSHKVFQESIVNAVNNGNLKIEDLDNAVSHVLTLKFELGLFEKPFIDTTRSKKYLHSIEHQQLALQAGRESICLLKNENNILPFSKNIKSIAVIGPLANVPSLGGYSPKNVDAETVLDGIKEKFGSNVKINYERGLLPIEALSVLNSDFLKTPDNNNKGLLAEYYNNTDFDGIPVYTQIETNMAPYFHNNSPAPKVKADYFSVRWTGTITAPVSGEYEIGIITDDKGRLYINNKLIVDNWDPFKVNVMMTKKVHLNSGEAVPIKMELGEEEDYAGIRLKWKLVKPDSNAIKTFKDKITNAVENSDITILVLGESSEVVGEGKDKSNLNLDLTQENIAKMVARLNKPFATVLLNGRPLSINWLSENTSAILEAWFPGEFAGTAIADVLFGDYNPSGKLPVTFPNSMGQLPVFYNYKPSSRNGYVDGTSEPLYHFGFGLSYTEFEFSDLTVNPAVIGNDDTAEVSIDVKNIGKIKGTEIVQLYIRDKFSSVVTPIMALKGFERVELKPNEIKSVKLKITPEDLSLWNKEMKRVVEPGEFKIMVGSSSRKEDLISTVLKVE